MIPKMCPGVFAKLSRNSLYSSLKHVYIKFVFLWVVHKIAMPMVYRPLKGLIFHKLRPGHLMKCIQHTVNYQFRLTKKTGSDKTGYLALNPQIQIGYG